MKLELKTLEFIVVVLVLSLVALVVFSSEDAKKVIPGETNGSQNVIEEKHRQGLTAENQKILVDALVNILKTLLPLVKRSIHLL